jgi:large subunit ribosomal protein L5
MKNKLSNLETQFNKKIIPEMMKRFGYTNTLEVPRLKMCTVNMGVGRATEEIKLLEDAAKDMKMICGQNPVFTKAKKSISNFKVRKGQPIGCRVTLRGKRMYEFTERLVDVAMPRIRDFRGISSKTFDDHGNCTIGLREQNIFPEVVTDRITRLQGMNITFVTTAKTREEGLYLMTLLGMPFRGEKDARLVLPSQ